MMVYDVAIDWLRFVSLFTAFGAVGFYFGVLGRVPAIDTVMRDVLEDRAATIGAFGAAGWVLTTLIDVSAAASEKGIPFAAAFTPPTIIRCGALLVAVLAYVIARRGLATAWILAAAALLVGMLYQSVIGAFNGKWQGLVNPLHELGGSLWIGTLFVLVIAGIGGATSRDVSGRMSRGTTVALLVRAFSPVALIGAALLTFMGIQTAFHHVARFDMLWTTPYGIALLIKLAVVLCVLVVGAWNWRRVGPSLGSDSAVVHIRRSARWELTLAGIVLVVTAILVNLPVPR
jgi:copper transport protein